MKMRSGHIPLLYGWVIYVLLLEMLRLNHIVEAQICVQVDVTLRNRMDPGQVVSVDCKLNETSIDPKGFLRGGGPSGGTTGSITESLTPDDAIYCDFKLGFVVKNLIQLTVQCSGNGTCSPLSVDFASQGAYFNLTDGNQLPGLPDIPWRALLPPRPLS